MKTFKLTTCDLCAGLWLKMEYDCPYDNCPYKDNEKYEQACSVFDEYIEFQSDQLRELLKQGLINPEEEVVITIDVKPKKKKIN